MSLSPEDRLSVFELCQASGAEANDPMALLFLEWIKAKREMIDIARGKKEGIEHAAGILLENVTELNSTLALQKEVAEVLQKQIAWISFARNKIILGSFALGAISAMVGAVGYLHFMPLQNETLKRLGADLRIRESRSGTIIFLESPRITRAERTPQGVEIQLNH